MVPTGMKPQGQILLAMLNFIYEYRAVAYPENEAR
jgi:hypothetical protein